MSQIKTLLNVREAAALLRVSERTIFRYIHKGKLKASKVGSWRINENDIHSFLKQTSNITSNKHNK